MYKAEFVSAPAMLEAYQKKRLKGNGNKVDKNLLENHQKCKGGNGNILRYLSNNYLYRQSIFY